MAGPALADLNPDVELMPGYHRSSIVKQLLRGREMLQNLQRQKTESNKAEEGES